MSTLVDSIGNSIHDGRIEIILTGFGPSQWPICRDLDRIAYEPTSSLSFSDLGVFKISERIVCHRVIAVRGEGRRSYLMMGDAKASVDGWIPEQYVLGRVTRINDRPVSGRGHQLFSIIFGVIQYFYFWLFNFIFRTTFGKVLGRWRRYITAYPLFENLFPYAFRPWLLAQVESRQRVCEILRDGFLASIFNCWWRPPQRISKRLRPHGGDYGHSFYYDDLFSGGVGELTQVCTTIGNCRRALDIGGGSGRLADLLVKNGSDVTLVDSSETMILKARDRWRKMAPELRNQLTVRLDDICNFHGDRNYDVAIALNNGFEHLGDWSEVFQALVAVKSSLMVNGKLFVDVHNPDYWELRPQWQKGRWVDEGIRKLKGGTERLWSRTRLESSRLVWEHAIGHRSFTLCQTSLLWAKRTEWERAIQKAGFVIKDVWGNWAQGPANAHHPKLVFACLNN